ncbi:MAG: hypothetical protein WA431_14415 [Candidatus Cybelea sp.]
MPSFRNIHDSPRSAVVAIARLWGIAPGAIVGCDPQPASNAAAMLAVRAD